MTKSKTQNLFINYSSLIFLIFSILLLSCNEGSKPEQYFSVSGPTQGTAYNIQYGHTEIDHLQEKIDSLLFAFDRSLSTYKSNSLISRINRNDSTAIVDNYFEAVYQRSNEISKNTDGAFDITIGALANAWGFGDGDKKKIAQIHIDSLLLLTGYKKTQLKDGKIHKQLPGILFNVNAIAQGYSVDVVCNYLDQYGCNDYLVEIGGELRTKGQNNKGELWKIGIDKPVEQNAANNRSLQAILTVDNKAVATSGNYRQFYEEGGIKYSHTIDPRIGQPVRKTILSATIVANDCMSADAYATACMVMGIESSIQLIERDSTLSAYFIYSDEKGTFKEWSSLELKNNIDSYQ